MNKLKSLINNRDLSPSLSVRLSTYLQALFHMLTSHYTHTYTHTNTLNNSDVIAASTAQWVRPLPRHRLPPARLAPRPTRLPSRPSCVMHCAPVRLSGHGRLCHLFLPSDGATFAYMKSLGDTTPDDADLVARACVRDPTLAQRAGASPSFA